MDDLILCIVDCKWTYFVPYSWRLYLPMTKGHNSNAKRRNRVVAVVIYRWSLTSTESKTSCLFWFPDGCSCSKASHRKRKLWLQSIETKQSFIFSTLLPSSLIQLSAHGESGVVEWTTVADDWSLCRWQQTTPETLNPELSTALLVSSCLLFVVVVYDLKLFLFWEKVIESDFYQCQSLYDYLLYF